jgi:hypothetical protein
VAEKSKEIEFNFALVIATFMDPIRKKDYFFIARFLPMTDFKTGGCCFRLGEIIC